MRRWVAGALCGVLWPAALLAASPGAEDLAATIRSRLGRPEVVRGEFEQKKYIQALAKPLISRGDFVVARERGVLWRTRTPFAQTVRLTRAGIVLEQGGETSVRLSAEREPAVRAATGVLFALWAGDFDRLREHFELSGRVERESWSVALRPIGAMPAQLFQSVRMEGGNHIRAVDLLERNGDRTEIRFSRVRTEEPLTAEEEALLR